MTFRRFADGSPVGDVVPFFDEGVYHLFVLTPPPESLHYPERLRTAWRHLASRDMLSWSEEEVALEPGESGPGDAGGIWTGSVIRRDHVYHAFYTQHGEAGTQRLGRAVSTDGLRWSKQESGDAHLPVAPADFQSDDWRDPFVFWNPGEQRYWMLVTSRTSEGAALTRGAIAYSTSPDLESWSRPRVLHRSFLAQAPECSEIFELGGSWVLGYSRFTSVQGTVYRVANQPLGPWRSRGADSLDGPFWYASKGLTVADGRRISFGWIPDRDPVATESSRYPWLWGGDLSLPRELTISDAGSLRMVIPAEVIAAVGEPLPLVGLDAPAGPLRERAVGQAGETQVQSYALDHPVESSMVDIVVAEVLDVAEVGVIVQTNEALDTGVGVFYQLHTGTVRAVDILATRTAHSPASYAAVPGQYPAVASHQLGQLIDGTIRFSIFLRGDIIEAFVDSRCCLSYRSRSNEARFLAVVVVDGQCRIDSVEWRRFN